MKAEILQKIFITWFLVLSSMSAYNFYHNITDTQKQDAIMQTYMENKDRYDRAIVEQDKLNKEVIYLKGELAGIRCH